MQRTPFIVLILLTMSAAARAATHDLGSFTGVGWVWMLGLSLYAVLGVIILGMCKSAAASDALEDQTYAATLKQAGTGQGLSHFDLPDTDHPSIWPETLGRLNYADFEARFLDVHILSDDEIVVRVEDTVAPCLSLANAVSAPRPEPTSSTPRTAHPNKAHQSG